MREPLRLNLRTAWAGENPLEGSLQHAGRDNPVLGPGIPARAQQALLKSGSAQAFPFASATGEADSNPGWVTKPPAGHLSLPPLPLSGTVWVPQVTPTSGLRLLLARSSSATNLPMSPEEGWAGAELGLGDFFNTQLYSKFQDNSGHTGPTGLLAHGSHLEGGSSRS